MNKNYENHIKPFNPKVIFILIPVVGLFISFIYWVSMDAIEPGNATRHVIYGIITTAGLWTGCLLIVKLLWGKYPWEHHPVKHLIVEFFAILTYTLLFSSLLYYTSTQLGFIEKLKTNLIREIFTTVLITFFITTLHESVFFYRQWKYNFSESVKLQNQHLSAKYESLKSQLNPHFVFNSLNNLASIVDDNPLAVEYINQMSSYLRYMIKSNNEELVTLEEEMDMLKKYIYLHKIRFGDIFNVDIDIPEAYLYYKLPPLTLQMLIENCIKHNVISKNKPLYIQIKTGKDAIIIKNNRNPKLTTESTGQGLNNIKERYKYFTTREIDISDTTDFFMISIPVLE